MPNTSHSPSSITIHRAFRIGILAGLGLCILTVAYSIREDFGIMEARNARAFLFMFVAGILWYALAALRWTRATGETDTLVLRQGLRWGLLIGLAWTVEVIGADLVVPHRLGAMIGVLAAVAAAVLPAVAGVSGTLQTGRIWTGARVGFWGGVVSGFITFFVLVVVGKVVVLFPGLPGVETPPEIGAGYGDADWAMYVVRDYLAAGVSHLFLAGGLFCGAAGAFGGLLAWGIRSLDRPRS